MIEDWVRRRGKLHFTLIDPDRQTPSEAGRLAGRCESYGTDAVMVGGSTAGGGIVDDTVKAVKESARLPVILFPSTAAGVSDKADYVFWMMLLNSRSRRFLVGEQVKAALPLSRTKVRPIAMGYVVVSTSGKPTTVEKVGEVERIKVDDVEAAVAYALTAEYFGMHCVYLEAGSGAERPVPVGMIKAVRAAVGIPLIVGGGIRSPDAAGLIARAGADVVVTGTIVESKLAAVGDIVKAVKGVG